jgi:hypothetical protein
MKDIRSEMIQGLKVSNACYRCVVNMPDEEIQAFVLQELFSAVQICGADY